MTEQPRRWRAYDAETGTHLATGHEPDEPPEDARVVWDEREPDGWTEQRRHGYGDIDE